MFIKCSYHLHRIVKICLVCYFVFFILQLLYISCAVPINSATDNCHDPALKNLTLFFGCYARSCCYAFNTGPKANFTNLVCISFKPEIWINTKMMIEMSFAQFTKTNNVAFCTYFSMKGQLPQNWIIFSTCMKETRIII